MSSNRVLSLTAIALSGASAISGKTANQNGIREGSSAATKCREDQSTLDAEKQKLEAELKNLPELSPASAVETVTESLKRVMLMEQKYIPAKDKPVTFLPFERYMISLMSQGLAKEFQDSAKKGDAVTVPRPDAAEQFLVWAAYARSMMTLTSDKTYGPLTEEEVAALQAKVQQLSAGALYPVQFLKDASFAAPSAPAAWASLSVCVDQDLTTASTSACDTQADITKIKAPEDMKNFFTDLKTPKDAKKAADVTRFLQEVRVAPQQFDSKPHMFIPRLILAWLRIATSADNVLELDGKPEQLTEDVTEVKDYKKDVATAGAEGTKDLDGLVTKALTELLAYQKAISEQVASLSDLEHLGLHLTVPAPSNVLSAAAIADMKANLQKAEDSLKSLQVTDESPLAKAVKALQPWSPTAPELKALKEAKDANEKAYTAWHKADTTEIKQGPNEHPAPKRERQAKHDAHVAELLTAYKATQVAVCEELASVVDKYDAAVTAARDEKPSISKSLAAYMAASTDLATTSFLAYEEANTLVITEL